MDQFITDDADHFLFRGEARADFLTQGPDAHPAQQLRDDLVVDVRLEQRQSHLAQGFVNRLLVQDPLDAQRLEDALKFLLERIEHRWSSELANPPEACGARTARVASIRPAPDFIMSL